MAAGFSAGPRRPSTSAYPLWEWVRRARGTRVEVVSPGHDPDVRFNHDAGETEPLLGDHDVDAVLSIPATAEAPGVARKFVTDHRGLLPAEVVDDALLLVSELVTNAVQHGRTAMLLRVRSAPPGIGVAVADTGSAVIDETAAMPEDDAASGRGLAIVAALATAWGVDETVPPPGKTVWFELTATPTPT